MTGAAEVPGPGDPDGSGFFAAVVKGDKLCYVIAANRIEPATAAHIHAAPAGVAGGIVVGLRAPNRLAADCITTVPDAQDSTAVLTESELAAIVATPSDFYVNVHNATFPAGPFGPTPLSSGLRTHGRPGAQGLLPAGRVCRRTGDACPFSVVGHLGVTAEAASHAPRLRLRG